MTIEEYLRELRRLLPGDPLHRRRVLAEVENHLREAAERSSEEEAIARFGPPDQIARELAPECSARATAWAAVALFVCLGGFVLAYLAAENSLPPAPWASADDAPALVRWPTEAATWVFATAVVVALGTLALATLRLPRAALAGGVACGLALATACGLTLLGGLRRAMLYEEMELPGRLSLPELVVGSLYLASLAVAGLAAAGWALRVSRTAHRASRS